MECKKPITLRGMTFGCNQCLSCRINKRREWTHRILLEAKSHAKNSFVTLTYNEENYPKGGSLIPEDVTLFLKRLRKSYPYGKIRYYAVGEYGDTSFRPHYHLAIFGLGVSDADYIASKWDYGYTYTGELNKDSAQYIAGYVTKKMTSKDDPRLGGRYPEFARMSLKPAIGSYVVDHIKDKINEHGERIINAYNDVPKTLKVGNKSYPLGRTIVNKLRDSQGWELSFVGRRYPNDLLNKRAQKSQEKALHDLQEFEKANTSAQSLAEFKEQQRKQKTLNREVKHQIYNNRRL